MLDNIALLRWRWKWVTFGEVSVHASPWLTMTMTCGWKTHCPPNRKISREAVDTMITSKQAMHHLLWHRCGPSTFLLGSRHIACMIANYGYAPVAIQCACSGAMVDVPDRKKSLVCVCVQHYVKTEHEICMFCSLIHKKMMIGPNLNIKRQLEHFKIWIIFFFASIRCSSIILFERTYLWGPHRKKNTKITRNCDYQNAKSLSWKKRQRK